VRLSKVGLLHFRSGVSNLPISLVNCQRSIGGEWGLQRSYSTSVKEWGERVGAQKGIRNGHKKELLFA
jgi:hypothetical protein